MLDLNFNYALGLLATLGMAGMMSLALLRVPREPLARRRLAPIRISAAGYLRD